MRGEIKEINNETKSGERDDETNKVNEIVVRDKIEGDQLIRLDRIVHVQTAVPLQVLQKLKKLAGTDVTKDAIAIAIEHYITCPRIRFSMMNEEKFEILRAFHEFLYTLKEFLQDYSKNAFFEEYDRLEINPSLDNVHSHIKGVLLLLSGVFAMRDEIRRVVEMNEMV